MLTGALLCLLLSAPPPADGPILDLPPELAQEPEHAGLLRRVRPAMGTYVELTISGLTAAAADPAVSRAFEEIERIEALMSEWRPQSQLGRVNAAAGERAVAVDRELFDLLVLALDLAEKSDGAFDPTFAAMWGLWTFGNDGVSKKPDPAAIASRRKLIGWKKVRLDPAKRTVFLPERGMKLGLGGIAKGYAVDRAVAVLREGGVRDFVIKAGGELYASGKNGSKRWRVGVRDPRGSGFFATIELQDEAFDTSGDYERFFVDGGVRYHHIIDPATGEPARRSRSATVLARDCTTADALSTAVFVLGPARGTKLIEASPGTSAVIVDADNALHISKGLRSRLELVRRPTP